MNHFVEFWVDIGINLVIFSQQITIHNRENRCSLPTAQRDRAGERSARTSITRSEIHRCFSPGRTSFRKKISLPLLIAGARQDHRCWQIGVTGIPPREALPPQAAVKAARQIRSREFIRPRPLVPGMECDSPGGPECFLPGTRSEIYRCFLQEDPGPGKNAGSFDSPGGPGGAGSFDHSFHGAPIHLYRCKDKRLYICKDYYFRKALTIGDLCFKILPNFFEKDL